MSKKAKKSASPTTEAMLAAAIAAQKPKGPVCSVCVLPPAARQMVKAARSKVPPLSFIAIAVGLKSGGFPIYSERLAHHFRQGHENPKQ